MRLTNRLFAQHLGWTFKKHWQVQGKRVPKDTGATAELEKLGIKVKTVDEVLNPKLERKVLEVVGAFPKPILEDETHINWHEKPVYVYGDENVLLEGVPQAQILTNTLEISGFPKSIEETMSKLHLASSVDRNVQNAIMSSHVFDAEQVKLPKRRLPERPAFTLPREYGISHERRNRLLTNKLIFECEKLAGRSVAARRRLIDNAIFKATLNKESDLLQFAITADKLLTTTRPLEPVKGKFEGELPDLFPIKSTISIPKNQIYTEDSFYPFSTSVNCSHPHTIFCYFDNQKVRNLHGSNVSRTQLQSRTMLKAFAVAAARANQLHGNDVQTRGLPKPIVVQSIQSDGRTFHFGVFQLNTLDLNNSSGIKNYWFHQDNLDLFEECGYKTGRPYLHGYNKDVFRCLNAFYNSS